jgi:hypothetical protein
MASLSEATLRQGNSGVPIRSALRRTLGSSTSKEGCPAGCTLSPTPVFSPNQLQRLSSTLLPWAPESTRTPYRLSPEPPYHASCVHPDPSSALPVYRTPVSASIRIDTYSRGFLHFSATPGFPLSFLPRCRIPTGFHLDRRACFVPIYRRLVHLLILYHCVPKIDSGTPSRSLSQTVGGIGRP